MTPQRVFEDSQLYKDPWLEIHDSAFYTNPGDISTMSSTDCTDTIRVGENTKKILMTLLDEHYYEIHLRDCSTSERLSEYKFKLNIT